MQGPAPAPQHELWCLPWGGHCQGLLLFLLWIVTTELPLTEQTCIRSLCLWCTVIVLGGQVWTQWPRPSPYRRLLQGDLGSGSRPRRHGTGCTLQRLSGSGRPPGWCLLHAEKDDRGQSHESCQDQGLGQPWSGCGCRQKNWGSGLQKGSVCWAESGMEVSVTWLEQRTCRERGGHRGAGVHALHWMGWLQEPSHWGHGEKVEEAGRRLRRNRGVLGTLATSGCGGSQGTREVGDNGQKPAPWSVGQREGFMAGRCDGWGRVASEGRGAQGFRLHPFDTCDGVRLFMALHPAENRTHPTGLTQGLND